MATRSERDRQKLLQEKHQAILAKLLKDEDNKYCVDCDAKGPRWASWNLGIFLCIRCAGIHRNLGVHISKVKSVNLDTWTPEQIAMMEEMGNSRARAVYEANLPDHVRRPQTDSSLEAFIRAKYEHKKYIAKEWVPPKPKVPTTVIEEPKKEKKRNRPKSSSIQLSAPSSKPPSSVTSSGQDTTAQITSEPKEEAVSKKSNIVDLLGLDDPGQSTNGPSTANDIFDSFVQAPSTNNTSVTPASSTVSSVTQQQPENTVPASSSSSGLDEALFGDNSQAGENAKSTKDSIMALFGNSSSSNQQMFGVPGGMYMQQQGQQPQMNMMGGTMQNGMMHNNMMGGMPNNMMQQQPNMPVQSNMGWDQTAAMSAMQNNMMGAMMMGGIAQQPNMMNNQQNMMMHQQQQQQQQQTNMYNMGYMQQQPAQVAQVQNQMAGLNLGGVGGLGGFQQNGSMATWNAPQAGQTLSTNLWQ